MKRLALLILSILSLSYVCYAATVNNSQTWTIQTRRDTIANWTHYNPVLAQGEEGCEMTGTNPPRCTAMKVGDGVTHWLDLPYFTTGSGGNGGSFASYTSANTFTKNQTVNGTVTATSFVGDGSGLTGIATGSGGPAFANLSTVAASGHRYWRATVDSTAGNTTWMQITSIQLRTSVGGSNVATSGTVTTSHYNTNNNPFYGAGWDVLIATYPLPQYIQIYLPTAANVVQWSVSLTYPSDMTRAPSGLYLSYSDDGITWTVVDTRRNQTGWVSGAAKVYDIPATSGVSKVSASTAHPTVNVKGGSIYYDGSGTPTLNVPQYDANNLPGVAKVAGSGDYNDLINKPLDPSNASNITSGTLSPSRLPTSGVSAGSYINAGVTVDQYGRVTAINNGNAPGSHAYWGIRVNSDNGGAYAQVSEIQIRATSGGASLTPDPPYGYGQYSGGSYTGGLSYPWDGDNSTVFGFSDSYPQIVYYVFPSPVSVAEYTISLTNLSSMTGAYKDFDLVYSDDGTTWTTADTRTNQTGWVSGTPRVYTLSGSGTMTAAQIVAALQTAFPGLTYMVSGPSASGAGLVPDTATQAAITALTTAGASTVLWRDTTGTSTNGTATLTGKGGSGGAGTLTVATAGGISNATVTLIGKGGAGAIGTLTVSTNGGIVAVNLTGQGAGGGNGSLAVLAQRLGTASLTGQGATGGAGTVTAAGGTAGPTTEDLTTYTQVPTNRFTTNGNTITSSTLTAINISREESAYLYKDFGAGHFGNFTIDFDVQVQGGYDINADFAAVGVSNSLASFDSWTSGFAPEIYAGTDTSHFEIDFTQKSAGTFSTTPNDLIPGTTWYYCTLTRSGSTSTLNIYSDSARTALVHGLTSTGQATTTYRYLYILASYNSGNSFLASAKVANVKIH